MSQPPGITCHHSSLTFRVCWTWWQPLFAINRCCLSILGLSSYTDVPSHQMKTPSTPSSHVELSWLSTWPQFLPPSPNLFHNICLDSNHLIHSLLTVQPSFACTAALALAHCSQNNCKQLLEKSYWCLNSEHLWDTSWASEVQGKGMEKCTQDWISSLEPHACLQWHRIKLLVWNTLMWSSRIPLNTSYLGLTSLRNNLRKQNVWKQHWKKLTCALLLWKLLNLDLIYPFHGWKWTKFLIV